MEAVGRILVADLALVQALPAWTNGVTVPAVVHAGRPLCPEEIGLLGAYGIGEARVVRRPRLAVFAIGDNLLAPGAPPALGKAYDGDSALLAAAVHNYGGAATVVKSAHRTRVSLRLRLAEAIAHAADLIVITANEADFEPLRQLLREEGRLRLDGPEGAHAPLFGLLAGVPILGLPADPSLALACAERYLQPVVRHLAGFEAASAKEQQALPSPL